MTIYKEIKSLYSFAPETHYWFAKDVHSEGAKNYFAIPKEEFDDFPENQHISEILPEGQPITPYFDLEMEGVDNFTERLTSFLDWLSIQWQTEFGIKPDYLILDCCRNDKLSYHLLVKNCQVASVQEFKPFIKWLWEQLHKTDLPILKWKRGEEERLIFDDVPYSKNQCFRMKGQSKFGKPYRLRCEADIMDTMVRNTSGHVLNLAKYKKGERRPKPNLIIDNDKQAIYREEWKEYMKYNCLNKVALSNYNDWSAVGFALFSTFGEGGLDLWLDFCRINPDNQGKEQEHADFYMKMKGTEGKRKTFNTIRGFAKKGDKMFKKIYDLYIDKYGERHTCYNDKEARNVMLELIGDDLIFTNAHYYKHNNLWICCIETINCLLMERVISAPLWKEDAKGNKTEFWANCSSARKVVDLILMKNMETKIQNDKFHTTTQRRFCFLDGVLDFKSKRFYPWKEVDFPYYSVVQIPMNYLDYTVNTSVMDEVITKVLEPMFNTKLDIACRYLSRALAGEVEDKIWATYVGNRHCGKGVLYILLKAFGDYVKTFNLQNIMCERNRKAETSRDLYWLMDHEYTRVAVSQETPDDTKNLKVKSDAIKHIVSGGDEQVARRNYDRIDTHFKVDASLFILGNDVLHVEGDCNECRLQFESAIQFKSAEYIAKVRDYREDETEEERDSKIAMASKYRVKDPEIKKKCDTPEWKFAFIQIMMKYYQNHAVEVEYEEEIEDTIIGKVLKDWVITKNEKDMVLVALFKDYGSKISSELALLGVKKEKITKKGEFYMKTVYRGIKAKEPDV
jgi:hypothetical protein